MADASETDHATATVSRLSERIEGSLSHPSAYAYLALWLLGGISSFLAFTDLSDRLFNPTDGNRPTIIVYAFLFATIVHQLFIYWDIHQMEVSPGSYEKDLEGWFGSTPEISLRALIFLGILFCAGKFLPGFEILEHYYQQHPNQITHFLIAGLTASQFCLVVGSVFLFSLNVWWGVWAYKRRLRGPVSQANSAVARFLDDKLNIYAICDSLALLFWLSVAFALSGVWWGMSDVAKYVAVIYVIAWFVRGVNFLNEIWPQSSPRIKQR